MRFHDLRATSSGDASLHRALALLEASLATCWTSFLTYLKQHHDHIVTKCVNLIGPAKKLTASCTYGNYYTFGVLNDMIKNGIEEVSYHLRIAAEGS
jgi:hypothetical protein